MPRDVAKEPLLADLRPGHTDFIHDYQPTKLPPARWALLDLIAVLPVATYKILGEATGRDRTAIANSLKPLREAGLIDTSSEHIGQQCVIRITTNGCRALNEGLRPRARLKTNSEAADRVFRESLAIVHGTTDPGDVADLGKVITATDIDRNAILGTQTKAGDEFAIRVSGRPWAPLAVGYRNTVGPRPVHEMYTYAHTAKVHWPELFGALEGRPGLRGLTILTDNDDVLAQRDRLISRAGIRVRVLRPTSRNLQPT